MGIYIDSEKVKITSKGITYNLKLLFENHIIDIIKLLSSDGYILKDLNGLYITPKGDE